MDKRVANADAAIARHAGWRDDFAGRLRPVRHSGEFDRRAAPQGHEES